MIPYLLAVVGGYLIGQSRKGEKYAVGGMTRGGEQIIAKGKESADFMKKTLEDAGFAVKVKKSKKDWSVTSGEGWQEYILTFDKTKMEYGGEVGKGFTIKEMREKLNSMFPDSFSFTVGTFSQEGNKSKNTASLITDYNDPFRGLQDEDIKSKLYFPQYKRDHDIRFRVYQGGENTYFYFVLESEKGDQYIGQFGFKDQGDVPPSYITRFLAFIMKQYGLPFSVNHEVMAKGGIPHKNKIYYRVFDNQRGVYFGTGYNSQSMQELIESFRNYIYGMGEDVGEENLQTWEQIAEYLSEVKLEKSEKPFEELNENNLPIKRKGWNLVDVGDGVEYEIWEKGGVKYKVPIERDEDLESGEPDITRDFDNAEKID